MQKKHTTQLPVVQPAEAVCAALGHGKSEATAGLDEASVLHVPGESGLAGDYHGGDAILALIGRMAELTDGTLRYEPSRHLDDRCQRVILRGRATAMRKGKRLDTEVELLITMRRGRMREIWISHSDQDQVDDFWA